MRITHHGIVNQVIRNIQGRLERIANAQQQITTGVRVSKPSDDPYAAAQIIELDSRIRRNSQYKRNIEVGLHHLRSTEEAMTRVSDFLIRARSIAIQGGNDTLTGQDRQTLAVEVDQMISDLLPVVNRKIGSQYLFGGSETRSAPYDPVTDADGRVTAVALIAPEPDAPFELIVTENDRVETRVFASDAFDGSGDSIFTVLIELRAALEADDASQVSNTLDGLDAALEQIGNTVALVGTRVNALQDLIQRHVDEEIQMNKRISDLEDIDLVEALTRLNEERNTYELALRTSAKVIQPSLVNFVYL